MDLRHRLKTVLGAGYALERELEGGGIFGKSRRGAGMIRWRILALLTLLSFVGYLLRTNMSVAGVAMMPQLGLSRVQLGWVLAGFAWGYALFQLPGGLLGDRLGSRKALTLIAVLWAVLNLLIAFVPGSSTAGTLTVVLTLASLRS